MKSWTVKHENDGDFQRESEPISVAMRDINNQYSPSISSPGKTIGYPSKLINLKVLDIADLSDNPKDVKTLSGEKDTITHREKTQT